MEITWVRSLVYNGVPLGLRFNTDEGIFDASRESLRQQKVFNCNLPAQVTLKLVGDDFISAEDSSGVSIVDISDNLEVLNAVVEKLKSSSLKSRFALQPVHQQSLHVFLNDPDWVAIRVVRNDEYNNQHTLRQPDGKMWGGGWIGKARSPVQAKAIFHYEQVFWALHRSAQVSLDALETYPDLQNIVNTIKSIQANVSISDSDVVRVTVNDKIVEFPLSTWPDRILSERAFANKEGLVPAGLQQHITKFINLDPRELTIMAIRYSIRDHGDSKGYSLQGGK